MEIQKSSVQRKLSKTLEASFPIVGIGASAGGLNPIRELLSFLPLNTGMAFVNVLHLDPRHRSHLVELFSKNTPMPVLEIQNGMRAEPNHVYVIPSGSRTLIENGIFAVNLHLTREPIPSSIDSFFQSLARDRKSNAIGVILSGTGSDGTDGISAIKAAGGTSFAQEPKSAKYDSMPRSAITSGHVDYILQPREIAEKLAERSKLTSTKGSLYLEDKKTQLEEEETYPGEALSIIFDLLKRKMHMDFSGYKLTTINRRIQRRISSKRFASIDEYVEHLQSDPEEIRSLYEDIFIHVTEFFRDPESFQSLKDHVFPQLFKNRAGDSPIRIWVPGCSSGEEAYSLAIVLFEFMEENGLQIPLQIFATDISEQAIQKARIGSYSKEDVRSISEERLESYFDEIMGGYKVKKLIRNSIIFSRHDLTSNPPFPRLDLISCRNVLIYFATSLQKRVLPIFHYALKQGGYLLLGRSETPSNFLRLFTPIDKTNKLYCKINESKFTSFRFPMGPYITERIEIAKKPAGSLTMGLDMQRDIDRLLLSKLAPAGVVIDGTAEILQVRGQVGAFIELPPGQVNINLLKMIRPELLPTLRLLIQSAKKNNVDSPKEKLNFKYDNKKRTINLQVLNLNPLTPPKDRQYLVLFEDISPAPERGKKEGRASLGNKINLRKSAREKQSKIHEQYIAQLQLEIEALKEHQQSIANDFASAQEELTSANEELQSTNEELQSTNEELETAKEELQAANEELTTTNDELQNRNLELNTANAALVHNEQRFRLMVENIKDYAIFMLDPEGRVASWNEGAKRLEGYEESEILGQLNSRFYLEEDVKSGKPELGLKVAITQGRFEDEGWRMRRDGSHFWANDVITAIRSLSGDLLWFSIIRRDLTVRRKMEEALKQSEERFRLLVQGVKEYAIYMLDPQGRINTWNEGAKRLKGYEESEVIGRHFSTFFTEEDRKNCRPETELKAATANGCFEGQGWRVRKDGSRFWASVLLTALKSPDGDLLGFSKITRNLNEQKQMEDALRKSHEELELRVVDRTKALAQAVQARDEFLSIASHELKTPLTSLKLQTQMRKRTLATLGVSAFTPDKIIKMIEGDERDIGRMAYLVDNILDITHLRAGKLQLKFERFDFGLALHEEIQALEGQLQSAGCKLFVHIPGPIVGEWDRYRVGQIFANLLTNAIKYGAGQSIHVSATHEGRHVRLVVHDQGIGIAKQDQERIFQAFERAVADERRTTGLGLGLYIVRQIVESHGGWITVQSEPEQGSIFTVELPMSPNKDSSDPG